MKKHTWDNPNKMHFESPHKTFNRQCRLISTGNQIGDVVCSNYIRPYNEVECNGFISSPGHLQDWDLTKNIVVLPCHIREEVRRLTHDNGGIIYNFHHWNGNKRIDDGFVLTTRYSSEDPFVADLRKASEVPDDPKLIKVWYVNQDWRARAAVDEAVKYITN